MKNRDEILSKILQTKIRHRGIRRQIEPISRIDELLSELSRLNNLSSTPTIIYCDTVVRCFSSFNFDNRDYIFFDVALIESLFIYDSIILGNSSDGDVEKYCYKLMCEEAILNKHPLAFIIAKHFKSLRFSFDSSYDVELFLSTQVSFLLMHELSHIVLSKGMEHFEFDRFKEIAYQFLVTLLDKPSGSYIAEGLMSFFSIKMNEKQINIGKLRNNHKLNALLEESYCDYKAIKVLAGYYTSSVPTLSASYILMHFLINDEVIRNSFSSNSISAGLEATETLFISNLRLHLLTMVIFYNDLEIDDTFEAKCVAVDSKHIEILNEIASLKNYSDNSVDFTELISYTRSFVIDGFY